MRMESAQVADQSLDGGETAPATSAEYDQWSAAWQWPQVQYDRQPDCMFLLHQQFLLENSPREKLVNSLAGSNNFLKGVKWSPDGSGLLACCEDTSLRLFDTPWVELQERASINLEDPPLEDELQAAVIAWEGETVYDFCWYPCMTASDPASCVFASTCREHPVHLWDAVTGKLRCTYRAYNAMDEITAAYSLAFNTSGTKLFCGYNKTLRVFDVARPGREYTEHSTLTPTKDGQTGIISCIAFNPDHSGMLAAGSYNRTIGLYDEISAELLFVLHGQKGGVTQVQFSRDGNYLYTGGRKDSEILCWDVRQTAGVVYRLARLAAGTNQRVAFDIEPGGRYLASGGEDGRVRVYDLSAGEWTSSFQAASDTVNGVSYHPSAPFLATSSGQRRFEMSLDSDDEEGGGGERDGEKGRPQTGRKGSENCLGLWRCQTAEEGQPMAWSSEEGFTGTEQTADDWPTAEQPASELSAGLPGTSPAPPAPVAISNA